MEKVHRGAKRGGRKMVIVCAACGYLHISEDTPFQDNAVRESYLNREEVPLYSKSSSERKEMVHYNRSANAEFKCEKCGAVNTVTLKWDATVPKEEVNLGETG
jgi:uncharacterized Zn finger protein